MTDTKTYETVVVPGKSSSLRLCLHRSENPRALLEECRKALAEQTGVPKLSMGQAAVAVWRDWLRMRREAVRQ